MSGNVPSDKVTDVAKSAADLPALAADAAKALQTGADKIRQAFESAKDTGVSWGNAADDLMRALSFQSNSPPSGDSLPQKSDSDKGG